MKTLGQFVQEAKLSDPAKASGGKLANNLIGADDIKKNADGTHTIYRGFYYRNGSTSEQHAKRISKGLDELGIKHEVLDHDTQDFKPFRGGASVRTQNHHRVTVRIEPGQKVELDEGVVRAARTAARVATSGPAIAGTTVVGSDAIERGARQRASDWTGSSGENAAVGAAGNVAGRTATRVTGTRLASRVGRGALNLVKGVGGKLAWPVAVGVAGYDAIRGYNANPNQSTGRRLRDAGQNALSGFTFGAVPAPRGINENLLLRGAQWAARTPLGRSVIRYGERGLNSIRQRLGRGPRPEPEVTRPNNVTRLPVDRRATTTSPEIARMLPNQTRLQRPGQQMLNRASGRDNVVPLRPQAPRTSPWQTGRGPQASVPRSGGNTQAPSLLQRARTAVTPTRQGMKNFGADVARWTAIDAATDTALDGLTPGNAALGVGGAVAANQLGGGSLRKYGRTARWAIPVNLGFRAYDAINSTGNASR